MMVLLSFAAKDKIASCEERKNMNAIRNRFNAISDAGDRPGETLCVNAVSVNPHYEEK